MRCPSPPVLGRPLSRLRPRRNERGTTARLAEALRAKAALALDSAEPVASAGRIRVSQSAWLKGPPGKSEPAAPGWRSRPTALLACSLERASPDARRPQGPWTADGGGMHREPATVGQRLGVSSQTCSQAGGVSRVERDHARESDRATPAASGYRRPESRVCRAADRSPVSEAPATGRRGTGPGPHGLDAVTTPFHRQRRRSVSRLSRGAASLPPPPPGSQS